MARYVPDIASRRWVILSANRADRPDDMHEDGTEKPCPFCEGHEQMTGHESYRVGGGEPNTPGWKVRVIPNKYPITDYHEVIIHAPDQETDLHELAPEHIKSVFETYKHRFNYFRDEGRVLIFCNRGERAGASIRHPHSQLVVIPHQINLDTLKREPIANRVEENEHFNIYCPEFSQWPYEVWISPVVGGKHFGDITEPQIEELVKVYAQLMKRLEEVYKKEYANVEGFSYNFYIHPMENWYIRIIPRFVHRAGFELGTGLSVNVTDPQEAARALRGREEEISLLKEKLRELENA